MTLYLCNFVPGQLQIIYQTKCIMSYPSYLSLYKSGELEKRVELLEGFLESCTVCPRECGINRLNNEREFCNSGYLPIVSSYSPHFGEEPVLVGSNGSGTIFMGNCNLRCVFCQNHDISQNPETEKHKEVPIENIADIMLILQSIGCHNINFVSPSHFVPQIIHALIMAIPKGFRLPIVYNTNSYDNLKTLQLLDGIVDIYLPDIKYSDDRMAVRYSKAPNYTEHSRKALKEMWRQVGSLHVDSRRIAYRGMLIRHLVMPNNIAGSYESLKFLAEELSPDVTVSVMAQYHPMHKAFKYKEINRPITVKEYREVLGYLEEFNMRAENYVQSLESHNKYLPNFANRKTPFKE